MDLTKINKVHFIGIGGIGVSAIAKLFIARGKTVTGSDVYPTALTKELEKKGVKIAYVHAAENLPDDADLVIFSPAIPATNAERRKAKKLNIEKLSYPEFLGQLSLEKKTIAVSGTNGKSTTTAMIGKIFEAAGWDPTVIVGTQVPGFDGNLRLGSSDWLIVEGCEWKAHMLQLSPQAIVLTNLEPDHLDFYKNLDDLKHHFQKFIDYLPVGSGFLAYNADDPALASLTKEKGYQISNWGVVNKNADFLATAIEAKNQKQSFKVKQNSYALKIPGQYNVYNALAAIAVARHFGIKESVIKKTLAEFPNCWRRFEILGPMKNKKNTLVISDYAHHPTAIKGVLKAAKEFYPKKRLLAVFQPHHYDRMAKLFDEFVKSFDFADLLIVSEIYDVAGRQKDGSRTVSSRDLVAAIQKYQPQKEVIYSASLEETGEMILKKVKDNDLILIVGAGDIDEVARKLI